MIFSAFKIISGLILILVFPLLLTVGEIREHYVILILYLELIVFVLWSFFHSAFKNKCSISKRKYYIVRAVGAFILIYLILGGIYYSGSMENYGRDGFQDLQIIYDPEMNYYTLNGKNEISSQLVLLETAEYYYVTDIKVTLADGLNVQIWGDDSYRFISKIDCPVKNIYARVSYIGSRYEEPLLNKMFGAYAVLSLLFGVSYIPLLSIPMKKEEDQVQT